VIRVLFFAPHNIHIEPILEGLREVNPNTSVFWYEAFRDPDSRALDLAQALHPDLVVYEGQNGGAMISTDALCRIKQICPLVIIVHDGSDVTWARLLHEYRERDAATCIVNIDGNPNWERGSNDITALTPSPTRFYK
jgi:hypothetical protein